MQSVQLSQEELLLLLGVLRLPMPLALGENPTAGHDERSLGVALAGAMSSLMARELILGDDPNADPRPAPGVQDLLETSALAERCLLLAARRGENHTATHFSLRRGRAVVHTSPRPGVHRVGWVEGDEPYAARLVAAIVPQEPAAPPLRFALSADAFSLALDALSGGQAASALGILRSAGMPADLAESFIGRAGSAPAQYAIVCLSQLQSARPVSASAMVVQGVSETWYVTDHADTPNQVLVETVGPEALQARLDTLTLPLA